MRTLPSNRSSLLSPSPDNEAMYGNEIERIIIERSIAEILGKIPFVNKQCLQIRRSSRCDLLKNDQ